MEHKCALKTTGAVQQNAFRRHFLISKENPLALSYFKSECSIREELERHIKINKNAIHPFSTFRVWYDLYLIFLYATVLISKPVDAAFLKWGDCANSVFYSYYQFLTDMLCWIDIVINCYTGYELRTFQIIELRSRKILKHYMLSPYFLCDLLSSIPKCLVYRLQYFPTLDTILDRIVGGSCVLGLLKVIRICSFMKYIWRAGDYFRISSKPLLFLFCALLGLSIFVHWLTCLQFAIPRLTKIYFSPIEFRDSWFYSPMLYNGTLYDYKPILIRYNHCLFKTSACILGINMDLYAMHVTEEYILTVFTYFIGKILTVFVWVILAVAILNARTLEIKYAQVINQLEEYMKQKQLPLDLRGRVLQYFSFKYRNKYYQEKLIVSLLSESLKKEATLHVCKSLMKNVTLFSTLNTLEVSKVLNFLIPEIFLPNDIIIHAGTHGNAMYFLSTGTVAVYTRSGREICHLQDGAYFGEISLVVKNQLRTANVVALETSQVYRLTKKDLERCFLGNKVIMMKILETAENRLKQTVKMEDEYKELMFHQSIQNIRD